MLAPFARSSLVWLVPAAFCAALQGWVPGIATWWLAFFAQMALLWHGLSLLGRFASGVLDANSDTADEVATLDVVQRWVIIWVGIALLSWGIDVISSKLGVLFDVSASFVKPAILVLLAMHSPIADALNPARWWFALCTLRSRYFVAWFGFLLVSVGTRELLAPLQANASLFIFGVGLEFIALAALLASFCLLGFCMYERADELGVLTSAEREEQVRTAFRLPAEAAPTPAALIATGHTEEGLTGLYEEARREPHQVLKQQAYYDALMAHGTPERQGVQAARLLRAYARAARAADVARTLERWWPALRQDIVSNITLTLDVAKLCAQGGQPELALDMLRAFAEDNKGLIALPSALLAQAELLQSLGKHAEAAALARHICELYAHSPEAARARELSKG